MAPVKILVFSGSIRTGSYNTLLAGAAARELALAGAEVSLISLEDYPLPIYDGDFEKKNGVPDNVVKLKSMIDAHDGVFIASPEYNHSVPPLLSNTIDWLSRLPANETGSPADNMPLIALGSAAPGIYGGARTLVQLRTLLSAALGALVLPRMISVVNAGDAFDATGHLKVEPLAKGLKLAVNHLIDVATRMRR